MAVLFTMACGYTSLLFYGLPLAEANKGNCSHFYLNKMLPWSSGCFYSAYFLDSSSPEQLEFEHSKLTRFHSHGGAAKHIRWYRSVFYRKYNNYFNLSPLELLKVHHEFIKISPNSISEVASFLKYLTVNESPDLAQQWLNEYCHTYISPGSPYVVVSLEAIMNKVNLLLSLKECKHSQKIS